MIQALVLFMMRRKQEKTFFILYLDHYHSPMPRVKKNVNILELPERFLDIDYSVNPNLATAGPHPDLTEGELKQFET